MSNKFGIPPLRVADLGPAEQGLRNAISDATDGYVFTPQEIVAIVKCLADYGVQIENARPKLDFTQRSWHVRDRWGKSYEIVTTGETSSVTFDGVTMTQAI